MSLDDLKTILSLVSPTVIILGAIITAVKWAVNKLDARMAAHTLPLIQRLESIDREVKITNGTVITHSRQIDGLEGAVRVLQQDKELSP